MSKRWTAVLEDDLDGQLRHIKEREGYESRSETARQMLLEGVESYRTSALHGLLEKGALIGAIGALMAALLFVGFGGQKLLNIAILLGVSSIALGAGSALEIGVQHIPVAKPRARTDGGQRDRGGDEE